MLKFLFSPSGSRYIIAVLFVLMGILHFVKPLPFVKIIPDILPFKRLLVFVSGVAELAGGIGLLLPGFRPWAAWGLILLLLAVFPANINMAVQAIRKTGWSSWYGLMPLLRLPLQFVLIYWIYWAGLR